MNIEDFPQIGGLMVSKMVVEKNIKPNFMYREKRSFPNDSGWRIFTGLESQDYIDNPDNSAIYNPSTILKIDLSIAPILLKGIGAVYEKNVDTSEWDKVTDFELEDDYLVTHQLTDKWTIDINNLFERRQEENGDTLYTTGDKSVRLIIWNEIDKSKKEIETEQKESIVNRNQSLSKTLDVFNFSDDKVSKVGYLIKEKDGEKSYSVIYGTSIIDNEVLETALYFDELEDFNWAIETWKSIKVT